MGSFGARCENVGPVVDGRSLFEKAVVTHSGKIPGSTWNSISPNGSGAEENKKKKKGGKIYKDTTSVYTKGEKKWQHHKKQQQQQVQQQHFYRLTQVITRNYAS